VTAQEAEDEREGDALEPGYQQWLNEMLPQVSVTVWPGSGHFPHLAHPDLFAECLATTSRWPVETPSDARSATSNR